MPRLSAAGRSWRRSRATSSARSARPRSLAERLDALARRSPRVREARGLGLMCGLELVEPAAAVIAAARERHLLVLSAGANVIRIVPPLTISREELERGVTILAEVLS